MLLSELSIDLGAFFAKYYIYTLNINNYTVEDFSVSYLIFNGI